ncbi:nucleic acid-binding protein [Cryphonectria parasitica EP155]|uniref:rRNA biogenesis protein RRP5 n=1 Tax=Cryphonectria parasitica (strain ATCC 38755 / EP155) TaxID=660469 RepID=A0A9P5CTM1_CRYP1|nr:nucleic acid-binding protein [Cryphonectria parasitica EP155]KAF3769581.1 nucleic acid-binding protein [Cryphonectria parasitica EP155]
MSSLKRKDAPSTNSSTQNVKPATDTRPSKKAKSDKPGKSEEFKKGSKTTDKTPSSGPAIATIKDEEPLFPRGGGSVLTPLEHKQITIEAKRDALFEEEFGKSAKTGSKDSKKKRRKSSTKDAEGTRKSTRDEDAVKIEGLNYKRLVKGSLVLGQVCEINDLDVALALPNNLVGHVSIAAISPALTKRIEEAAASDDADADADADNSPDDDIDTKELFDIGQYLRAYVVSTMEDSSALPSKAKRRIELSLRPEDANSTLSQQELVTNSTVMASIASVEDHGYVMDIGIAGSNITGFMPKKEVDPSISEGRLQPGNVFLCISTGLSANRKVAQLSTKSDKLGSCKNFPSEATTINTFVPGTAVEVLVSEITERGLIGKVLGHLDATADHIHSGIGPNGTDLAAKHKVGSKLKARIICTFPEAKKPKLGISILEHVKSLQGVSAKVGDEGKSPLEALPISSFVEECVVRQVETDIGLFVDVGIEGIPGFVHISRVKDGKVDGLYESSGPFKVGSKHRGRVVGYNAFDGFFLLSFEKTVLDQPFLRVEDVPVGGVINGVVEKLVIGENGVHGLILKLAEGISGLVPEMHLSDVRLQHPEKKFREGMKVKARVLSTNPSKRQLRLTLKKTLVNSDEKPIKSFDDVSVGMQVLGTIMNVLQNGAVVQFYGHLRGFLPLSEMSEAYISDPKEHFRQGQVVNVHVIDVDAETNRLVVSCKDPAAFGMDKQLALKKLSVGDLVSGKVSQKTEDDIYVELNDSLLKAVLTVGHLTDKSAAKDRAALKRIHVGQNLNDLVILEKNEGRRALTVTSKPSLVAAAKEGKLLSNWEKVKAGQLVHGFVRNITPTAVFVQFGGNLTALLPAAMIPQEQQKEQDFGMHKLQSVSVKIVSVDRDHTRAVVAIPSVADAKEERSSKPSTAAKSVENPVDDSIQTEEDIAVGKITKAKIVSIKSTQLNVQLADNIQGRVDVSQVYDSWDKIGNPKNPLQKFKPKQVIKVRVLGVHDARNHRFLPISHRSTHALIELSAKPSDLKEEGELEMLSLSQIEAGSEWTGFVNNIKTNCLWINLSPSVRGRMAINDASDDLSLLSNPSGSFPVGSAMQVRVKAVDASQNRLDLTARTSNSSNAITWDTIKKGLVLPGKITKLSDRYVMVQLSEDVSGPVHLADLEDDYDEAKPKKFAKNEIIRVAVVDVDASNKKLRLSTRPSRVLSSNLPVKDPEVTTVSALEAGEIKRGFVKNVADQGLFVNLGGHVTAFVKISDLSDSFLKDWKQNFRVDQLVKGRIIAVDVAAGQVNMSLKSSIVDNEYVPPKTLSDFTEGQVVTGKVRGVEEFGAFIVIDGTANVSGLCHRSEMAEKHVKDARKLYSPGDVVKARIMKIDLEKKKISFGLKPSYFEDQDSDEDMDDLDEDAGALLGSDEDDSDDDQVFQDAPEIIIRGTDNQTDSSEGEDEDDEMAEPGDDEGLDAGGFDWSGGALDAAADNLDAESDNGDSKDKKKKKRKPEIQVDRTAQLDANGPQTASDFERLLLGQSDSSDLWIQYMAFHLQVSEPAKACEIAERALKTINIREEAEKLNVWTAYLNMENAYGTNETLDEVFKRACQYNDEQVVHERLSTIYIKTGKHDKADELFQTMTKKFGAKSPTVWTNYAHFLHNTIEDPERARALLPRATQALPSHTHVSLMTKFAALEFRSTSGDQERGRTMFEGLLAAYPKKFDLWNQLLDLEISAYATAQKQGKEADATAVRGVFERGLKMKGLKPHKAKGWFQRWAKWEEGNGNAKSREKVSAKAKEWAREAEARKKAANADGDE